MTIKTRVSTGAGAVALAVAIACAGAGTAPAKGQPCDNPGDMYAKHGRVLTCSAPPGQSRGVWR